MNGRPIIRLIAVVLLLAIAIGIGAAVYNAGIASGIAQAQQAVQSGQPILPYAYGPYWHGGGFGFFGIFFWIIGFFLVIGLLRAVLGRGRGWGHRGGWGSSGYGKWGYDRPGRFGPGAGDSREDAISEWHKELHRREESGPSNPGTIGNTGSTGSASDQTRTGS